MANARPAAPLGRGAATLSLSDCHDLARQQLGAAAPSLVTLKRWSAAGILDEAKTPRREGGRPRYRPELVLAVVRRRQAVPSEEAGASDAPPAPAAQGKATAPPEQNAFADEALEALRRDVSQIQEATQALAAGQRQLASAVEALTLQVGSIARDMGNLDAARKMLMVNSDALTNQLRQRAEAAERALRSQQTNEVDHMRLMRALGSIEQFILQRQGG